MCRFAVVECKLREPAVVKQNHGENDSFSSAFSFLTLCMSHKSSVGSFRIVGQITFWYSTSNSYRPHLILNLSIIG